MIKDYSKNSNELTILMGKLRIKIPVKTKRFNDLHKTSISEGILPSKLKDLLRWALP